MSLKFSLCLDVTSRWHSTYKLLQAVVNFKKAFDVLENDAHFTKYFDEERYNGRNINGPPTHADWDKAQVFVEFLKTLYI